MLSACISSDDSSDDTSGDPDDNQRSFTTSDETCDDVFLGQHRRDVAATAAINVEIVHADALGIWKLAVSDGQPLTATMEVPDDKDYQMALFDTDGNKLACSDNAGFGTGEQMEYEVDNLTMVWLKVWTSASPNRSEATIMVSTPVASVPTAVTELEPNDTHATAQEIGVAHSLITSTVADDSSDADDYFVVDVTEGDIVTVTAEVASNVTGLAYVALVDEADEKISVEGEELSAPLDTEPYSATLVYEVPASMTQLYVWMSSVLGTASYELEIQVQSPD